MAGPKLEYERRRDARRAAAKIHERRDRSLSTARMAVFLVFLVAAWLAWGPALLRPAWLLPLAVVFLALLIVHERIIAARDRARRAVRFYEEGLARLAGEWAGRGRGGESFADDHHPYASDFDLFGRGSLYELLCAARTTTGEATLASWLKDPADVAEVGERHAAVRELTPRLDLREDLALLGDDVRAEVDPGRLAAWGGAEPVAVPGSAAVAAPALAAVTVLTLIAWIAGYGYQAFLVAAIAELVFARWLGERIERILHGLDRPTRDLETLGKLLARLEEESFAAPRLAAVGAVLRRSGAAPSRRIAQLHRLMVLLDSRHNQFFAAFAWLLLWTPQVAMAIERWRAAYGRELAGWLTAVGELEALASLAGYSFEHPSDPFPEVVAGDARIDGVALGHPLLSADRAVRNDVRLDRDRRLLIVSGSNMSGKSTLLRTVGVNVVLALAGAPVRAERLTMSPLRLGASIRLSDSLAAGESRFYAEILRIHQIMDMAAEPRPLLFMLDEILHGTNSHDRRIGAQAILRGLIERGALGLVTTHDLALTNVGEGLEEYAENVHFEDRLEEGKMFFDYKLRAGVVERSNALELMRAVGLEV